MLRSPSFGRRLLPTLTLLGSLALTSCWDEGCQDNASAGPLCDGKPGTIATVRDLTGLDGCGKVLELAGGKRLEPVGAIWTAFASTPGQRVVVAYEPFAGASICMTGEMVTVTCIRAADANDK